MSSLLKVMTTHNTHNYTTWSYHAFYTTHVTKTLGNKPRMCLFYYPMIIFVRWFLLFFDDSAGEREVLDFFVGHFVIPESNRVLKFQDIAMLS